MSAPRSSSRRDTDAADGGIADWRSYGRPSLSRLEAAALAQFVEFGFHGTSIRRLAEAAGVTVPGLYYHFASKGDVLASLLLHAQTEIVERHRAALASVPDEPRARFVVQVENSALYTMYRQEFALLAREIRFLPDQPRVEIMGLRDELERSLYRDIGRGAVEGVFSVAEARAVGRAILVLCRSISGWYRPSGPSSPEEIATEYVGYALRLVGDAG